MDDSTKNFNSILCSKQIKGKIIIYNAKIIFCSDQIVTKGMFISDINQMTGATEFRLATKKHSDSPLEVHGDKTTNAPMVSQNPIFNYQYPIFS